MKAIVRKLVIIGLLMAAMIVACPRVMALIDQTVKPPEVKKAKPVLPPPGVKHLEKVEDLVFEMTNAERRAHGLKPLIKDDELRQVARAYSDDMLVRQFFDHTDPDGVTFDRRIVDHYPHRVFLVGENIWDASGYDPANTRRVAREIMDSWMTSQGHRENLLDPGYTHLGVGVSARHDNIRATQEFVKRPPWFFIFGDRR